MPDKGKTPIKISVPGDIYDALDAIATRLRKEIRSGNLPSRGRGKSWGAGTVASDILERTIRAHPEILEEWLTSESMRALWGDGDTAFAKALGPLYSIMKPGIVARDDRAQRVLSEAAEPTREHAKKPASKKRKRGPRPEDEAEDKAA